MKLREDVKAEWVAALRSGEWVQGRGRLKSLARDDVGDVAEAYCCLGVLCEHAARAGVGTWSTFRGPDHNDESNAPPRVFWIDERGNGDMMPPAGVVRWAFADAINEADGARYDWPVPRAIAEEVLGGSLHTRGGHSEMPLSDLDDEGETCSECTREHVGLSDLNDTYRLTFEEIAEVIERAF